jgi:hypothetical protein
MKELRDTKEREREREREREKFNIYQDYYYLQV